MLKPLTWGIKKYLPAGALACALALTVANGMAEIITSMQYPTMPSTSPGIPHQMDWTDHEFGTAGSDMLIAAFPDLEYVPEDEAVQASGETAQPVKVRKSVRTAANFELARAKHEASSSRATVVVATGESSSGYVPMTGTGSAIAEASAVPTGPAPASSQPATTDNDKDEDEKDEAVPVTPPAPGTPDNPGGGMGTSTGDPAPTR